MNFLKKTITSKCTLVNLIILLMLCSTSLMAQQKDFSGVWNLNRDKTDFGSSSENSTPVQLKVIQTKEAITIERMSKNSQGDTQSYVEKLPFKSVVVESSIKTTKKSSSIKWSADHLSLIESAKYFDNDAPAQFKEFKGMEIFKLSDDGKTLTIEGVDELSSGDKDIYRSVYQKQE